MSYNEALYSSRVSELLQEPNFAFCCDKDQVQVNFQVYSAGPRIPLLPPLPLDGSLTDSTNNGCEWRSRKFSQLK